MHDLPEYSISEFLLAGLFFVVCLCAFIYGGYSLHRSEPLNALEAFGIGLMFLCGCADPKKYFIDCLTFPFSNSFDPAGRDTLITVTGGYLGLALWLLGAFLDWHLY